MLGWKVTAIVQILAGCRLLPQLLVCKNGPVALMLETERADAPVLVKVTFCEGGGQVLKRPPNLQLNDRSAGISCTLPFVSVIDALLVFVWSLMETALTLTLGFAGIAAGP